jgi:hypothetical protein
MFTGFLTIVFVQWCVLSGPFLPPATALSAFPYGTLPQGRSRFRVREANVHAPHVYADDLDVLITLVDLPGARNKQSYWEISYQLYFISEDKFDEAVARFPRGGSNPKPEQFPGRMLLTEGHKKIRRLGTLKERTINITGVPFKAKVPDAQRTKFASLMTHYSVKIFDAELNTTVFRSGIFLTEPYDDHPEDPTQSIARKTIYLNFMVTPTGFLNLSQLPRRRDDTKW